MATILHITHGQRECGIREYTINMMEAIVLYSGHLAGSNEDLLAVYEREHPALVHLQWGGGIYGDLNPLRNRCREDHIPFVLTVHNELIIGLQLDPDFVIVHTADDMNKAISHGWPQSRIVRINQGIVLPPMSLPPPQYGLFTIFGFLLPHKGILEAIKAFSVFVSRQFRPDDWRLALQTSIHPHNLDKSMALLGQVRDLISALQINHLVRVYTNFIPRDDLLVRLARSMAIVYPYLSDANQSASAAITAGFAAGRPCVVSDINLFAGFDGVIRFKAGDIAALADAMEAVVQPANQQRLTAESIANRDRWAWPRIVTQVIACYPSTV